MKFSLNKGIRPEILREKAYRLEAHPKAIKLNQNELPYDLPPSFKKMLFQRFAQLPLQRYPLCQPLRLQKRLANLLKVRPAQIQISNGSNVMIQALMMTAAIEGKVMILEPTFSVYKIQAKLLGNQVIEVPLEAPDFGFPLKKFLARIKEVRPNIIFIPNPNAPTGNLFPQKDLIKILEQTPCLVVIDEAYVQFSQSSLLPKLKSFPNLVILRTFSKGFGLGGVRVGYMVASEEVSEQVGKIILPYSLPILSEEAALFTLDHQKHFQPIIREVLAERERMLNVMSKISGVQVFSSDANFILFRTRDALACFQFLLKKGILVRNVSDKFHLKNCLRVSVGKPGENEVFLKILRSWQK